MLILLFHVLEHSWHPNSVKPVADMCGRWFKYTNLSETGSVSIVRVMI